jgi:O-antigen/teichoic acid export membrane protein
MIRKSGMKLKNLFDEYYGDHLYRNSIMVMLNLGFSAMCGFVFWIIVAHVVSPSDVGLSTAALSLATLIVTFSGLGMNNGMIRFLPQMEDKKTLFSSILIVNLIVATVLTVIILLFIRLFFPPLEFLTRGIFPIIFLLYLLLASILSIQNFALIAIRRADLSLIQYIFCVVRLPLIFMISFMGTYAVFYSLSIAYAIAISFGLAVLYLSGISFTFKLNVDAIRKILTYSLGNYTADLFVNAPATIIPIIIIYTIGAANNAYYYIAYSISSLLFMIPYGISTSLFVEGSHDLPLRNTTIKAAKLLILILVPSLIVTFLFGNYLLLIFNQEYALKSFDLLKLLALSSIFSSVISIYTSILRVNHNIRMVNILYLLYSASIILLGYLGLVTYGLIGLGYAWVVSSMFVSFLISYNVMEKYVKSVYHRFVQS